MQNNGEYEKLKKYNSKPMFVLYVVVMLLSRGISLLIPKITEYLVDAAGAGNGTNLYRYGIISCATVLAYVGVLCIANYVRTLYEEASLTELKLKFIDGMNNTSIKELNKNGSGYYLQRFSGAIDSIRPFIVNKRVNYYLNMFYVAGISYLMISINLYYALSLLVCFPIIIFFMRLLARKLSVITQEVESMCDASNSKLEELYGCSYSIKANNAEQWFKERLADVLFGIFSKQKKYLQIESIYDNLFVVGLMNLIGVLMYFIGGIFVLKGNITMGMVISMSLYYSKLWNPVEFYLDYPKQRERYLVHKSRLDEVLNSVDFSGDGEVGDFESIEIKDLVYTLDERVLFNGVNLTVNKGDKIAISGENGSGKSTLSNIIAALIGDYEGELYYNGDSYRKFNQRSIRKHITLIPAKPELINGTVLDNIVMAKAGSGADDIPNPVRKILEEKNLALDMQVLEGGANFSSGETKLIELSRGLMQSSDVYIIDEPLNFIDDAYVRMTIDAIAELFKDKTLVIISHDRRVFELCDKHYRIERCKLVQ